MKDLKINNLLPDLYHKLDRIMEKENLKEKYVILFSFNVSCYAALQYLNEHGIKAETILDNDHKKHGDIKNMRHLIYVKEPYLVQIKPPEDVLVKYIENARILVFARSYDSICDQIEKTDGYKRQEHCIRIFESEDLSAKVDLNELLPMNTQELKTVEFNVLKEFKKICEEYGLKYYLYYGTLLGAVRHRGFIPWDEDIDVCMPVRDYKKLIEIYKKKNEENGRYVLYCPQLCDNFLYLYGKLTDTKTVLVINKYPLQIFSGVSIDIFPLSGFPESKKEQEKYIEQIDRFNQKWYKYRTYYGIDQRFLLENFAQESMDLIERYDEKECGSFGYIFYEGNQLLFSGQEAFQEETELEFEGEWFHTFAGWHEYLTQQYGDYMTPPPQWEIDCGGKHFFTPFWKKMKEGQQ